MFPDEKRTKLIRELAQEDVKNKLLQIEKSIRILRYLFIILILLIGMVLVKLYS